MVEGKDKGQGHGEFGVVPGLELGQAERLLKKRNPHPRLKSFDYSGRHAYHVVTNVAEPGMSLPDDELPEKIIASLIGTAAATGFRLLAFCMMPNHLHILALGRGEDSNLVKFMQQFKQKTAFSFKKDTGLRLWQMSFYDRVLRMDEDLNRVATYIFQNPVEEGLVTSAEAYLFSGGEYFK